MNDAAAPDFALDGAVYLVRPTGHQASDLDELRGLIEAASDDELFFHSQMPRLRLREVTDLAADDFSAWARGVIQDTQTAERLAFAVQTSPHDPRELRAALLAVLDDITSVERRRRSAPDGGALVGLTHETVRIPTGVVVGDPGALMDELSRAHPSVWFHHLIEIPWTAPPEGTVAAWLREHGAARLATLLEAEAASGRTVAAARRRLLGYWKRSNIARRIADRAVLPEDVRRESEHAAVAGLVKRIRNPQGSK